ncbi:hypothetical protein [Streptomyces sp. MNP-20]|uniref:hypothetical protein n=1 Tax=Streptomyces sp. MNP-20 TaxID=2721165 RepID=UPI001553754A|nr:hypothetical protein [Streptomyces sp. MNP-20]
MRIGTGRAVKGSVVAALAAAAVGVSAQSAFASAEDHWTGGCRGYWYSTSGHAYCKSASGGTYDALYDCKAEVDGFGSKYLSYRYKGKWHSHECTFHIRKTKVRM